MTALRGERASVPDEVTKAERRGVMKAGRILVDYARKYENLTNEQADALMNKAFELEAQRATLKKKYFDRMKTALSATQAAKFFLVENQLQHIVDLQISAGLPVVQTASN